MKKRLTKWQRAGYQFKLDWLLRNINAVVTGGALFAAMRNIDAATFREGLETTEKVIDRLLNLIASRLGLDHDRVLGSRYAIPLMSRYLVQRGGKLADQTERDRLLFWYVHTILWGRYSGSTESTLNHDLEVIADAEPGQAMNQLIESLRQERANLKLNESDFGGSSMGNRFYPLLYMMTRVLHARDWGTDVELTNHLLGHLSRLEVHHIFPKALLYEHGYTKRQVNAIANFTFLTQETNLEVSKRDPAEYIPHYEGRKRGSVASHWIPMEPALWQPENYLGFLEERRKLLAKAANDFLDRLSAGSIPVVVSPDEAQFVERAAAYVPGGVGDDAEEARLIRCNNWVTKRGLPAGELSFELLDQDSGDVVAILDLAWPNGLQEGLSQPVAVLIGEGQDVEEAASQAGFRFFSSPHTFRRYVKQEVLAEADSAATDE